MAQPDSLAQLEMLAALNPTYQPPAPTKGDRGLQAFAGGLATVNATMRGMGLEKSIEALCESWLGVTVDATKKGLAIPPAIIFGGAYTGKTYFNTLDYLKQFGDLFIKRSSLADDQSSYRWAQRIMFTLCTLEGAVWAAPQGILTWTILDLLGTSAAVQGLVLTPLAIDLVMENAVQFWKGGHNKTPKLVMDGCHLVGKGLSKVKNWAWNKLGWSTTVIPELSTISHQNMLSFLRKRDEMITATLTIQSMIAKLPDTQVEALHKRLTPLLSTDKNREEATA